MKGGDIMKITRLFSQFNPHCPCPDCEEINPKSCEFCKPFENWLIELGEVTEATAEERVQINELMYSS